MKKNIQLNEGTTVTISYDALIEVITSLPIKERKEIGRILFDLSGEYEMVMEIYNDKLDAAKSFERSAKNEIFKDTWPAYETTAKNYAEEAEAWKHLAETIAKQH